MTKTIGTDESGIPLVERIREAAEALAGPDDVLDFYSAARELGLDRDQADRFDAILSERVMRARGAI